MTPPHGAKLGVFVVDDHPIVREGFLKAFDDTPDLTLTGHAGTAAEALSRCPEVRPDIIVIELALPDRDGAEVIAALRGAVPGAKVIVVSGYDDEYRVAEALRAGAHGYLLKTSPTSDLVAGIRTAAAGGSPLSPTLSDAVLRAMRKPGKQGTGTIDALTGREVQVLRLFATGLSTRDVAASLGISPKTVETHRIRIYDKLGCKSVVDLTRIAVRTGLVEP